MIDWGGDDVEGHGMECGRRIAYALEFQIPLRRLPLRSPNLSTRGIVWYEDSHWCLPINLLTVTSHWDGSFKPPPKPLAHLGVALYFSFFLFFQKI